jgi:drug/metabolite transporter (DMT)-like permease
MNAVAESVMRHASEIDRLCEEATDLYAGSNYDLPRETRKTFPGLIDDAISSADEKDDSETGQDLCAPLAMKTTTRDTGQTKHDFLFLDMQLIRQLSILPRDIADAADAAVTARGSSYTTDKEAVEIEPAIWSTCLLLASAVSCLSAVGPLLQYQTGVSGSLKVVWRLFASSLLLLPFAVGSVYKHGLPSLSPSHWAAFVATSFFYGFTCVGFSVALEYTSVGNAVILANSQAILLLSGKLCLGHRVTFVEASGAVTAFVGVVLCSRDTANNETGSSEWSTLFGDCIALLAGAAGVGYFVFAKAVRPHIKLSLFMYSNMLFGSIVALVFAKCLLGEPMTFDREYHEGIFGWMRLEFDRLPLEIIMVIVCNILGTVGYVRAMQFFNNLVISTAGLMEPVIAELMAVLMGVGYLPGVIGWLGNLAVVAGTLLVVSKATNE